MDTKLKGIEDFGITFGLGFVLDDGDIDQVGKDTFHSPNSLAANDGILS